MIEEMRLVLLTSLTARQVEERCEAALVPSHRGGRTATRLADLEEHERLPEFLRTLDLFVFTVSKSQSVLGTSMTILSSYFGQRDGSDLTGDVTHVPVQ